MYSSALRTLTVRLIMLAAVWFTPYASALGANDLLTFQKLADESWQVTISGTDYFRACETVVTSSRVDALQRPPLITLFRAPGSPPILFCGPPDPPLPYSYRLNLGRLAPDVYKVQVLVPTPVTAFLDTRPVTVPTLSNAAWLLMALAVALFGVAARRISSR